ncbi:MAG: hypothetical protein QOC70_2845 [Verrucomicrobiota bacterium]|jgi:hypothetical protein
MNCMTALQTARLNLRPFPEDDLDGLSPLMANTDFMRFSLGMFSREQTARFLEKVRRRNRAGLILERKTVFRGFPAIVFGISREQRNGH